MSILNFLQLQPVEPTTDDSVSPLDDYQHDVTFSLDDDVTGEELVEEWTEIEESLKDSPEKLTFSDE